MLKHFRLPALIFTLSLTITIGQSKKEDIWADDNFNGLEFRSIGPAFMSGRISDIAVHPEDNNIWYVSVGSGNVWKTENAGITWTPIFDDQGSYSIGCVTIDPNNPNVVWVGTGEDLGGRHFGYGDGVYRSDDGGKTWTNMGLKNSEPVSKIVIHPNDSNTIWVASQGPLWSKGGERGVYKTTDGGKNWKLVLSDNEWTGATELVLDPRNPDRIYVAMWQRHRTIAAYMGGGPGSGIHRSEDGGETWKELKNGLPESNMGKIGLDISKHKPDVLYAAIELDRRSGGVYKSMDRGETWVKQSDAVAGATGPHYYQELYASPHYFDRLYLMDANMQISNDGGKTFYRMNEKNKHGDNHAIAFRKDDPDYLLVGSDGGLYESFDHTKTWRFMANLPLTQFYDLALDDSEPFYNIFGGTQDNSTEGGPSRTDTWQGIQNSDWRVVLNWDGHQPATEPGNPNIMYGQRQQGTLARIDMITGEVVDVQPQPRDGEVYERFNWDSPILVSPHKPSRLYFASQRVWKSDNRGDSWEPISDDLTRNQNRFDLPIMGSKQSWDNPWDVGAMSNYNTVSALSESPVKAGLIYAGTDDGFINITENDGKSWRKVEVKKLPGVPATAYVNDVKADNFDVNKVYAVLDNHKYGDYQPYIYKSTDKGKTWKSITSNLPDRTVTWRIVQDHVEKNLLFAATEYGIYFSINSGGKWTKLNGGVPIISFRDLAIHKRENDLVGASFGRGFYVFDDISVFRGLSKKQMADRGTLFPVRKAWWYIPRSHLGFGDRPKGTQGDGYFTAPNPPFGAVFTYHLGKDLQSKKAKRKQIEKAKMDKGKAVGFPGWEAVETERREMTPRVIFEVKDREGNTVRRVQGPSTKGFHRVAWDLRYPSPKAVTVEKSSEQGSGFLAPPGTYSVTMYAQADGKTTQLSETQQFDVVPLRTGALPTKGYSQIADFWRQYEQTVKRASAVQVTVGNTLKKIARMQTALEQSNADVGNLDSRLHDIRSSILEMDEALSGNRSKMEPGEKNNPTVGNRLFVVQRVIEYSTYGPTATAVENLALAQEALDNIYSQLNQNKMDLDALSRRLTKAGAPWVEGDRIPKK